MGDLVSAVSGLALFVSSLFVIHSYWPRRLDWPWRMPPGELLKVGIFFGFTLTAANTLWWQLLNTLVVTSGLMTRGEFQAIGKWMDLPFKGGMAAVAILHLYALRRMLRDLDRR